MRKKGFTLIELLAVITILSIILLIVVPIVLGIIKDSKETSYKKSVDLYGRAIDNAIAAYYVKYPTEDFVTIDQLEKEKLIDYKGVRIECNTIQITNRKVYLSECKQDNIAIDYDYGNLGITPYLANIHGKGLTPVAYKNGNWIVVSQDNDNNEWYDYDNQKWANAVTLLPGVKKEIGDEVKLDGTEASMIYVWIPRYEYKYTNLENQYAGGTMMQPRAIDINFISKNVTNPSSNEYTIHPAFTFGDKQLNGIWIGKFEISHTTKSQGIGTSTSDYDAANLNCTTETCIEAQYLRVLPNKPSLRYNNVLNFWYGIKSIENTESFGLTLMDIHMMKNSEWGAVAYLSQSRYGKYGNSDYEGVNKEIYQNKSDDYITGKSNGTPSTNIFREGGQCSYDNILNNCGVGASTTGNIYGIYDMAGGSYDYVMGIYIDSSGNPVTASSGFYSNNFYKKVESKYYDGFKANSNNEIDFNTACNNGICYGQALSETAGWYGDLTSMINSTNSWFKRGGSKGDYSSRVGVFYYTDGSGISSVNYSTHAVCVE